MYVGRKGCLDGVPGLILCGLYAYYTFIKYARFWELRGEATPRRNVAARAKQGRR
jgi:hypothetical protein